MTTYVLFFAKNIYVKVKEKKHETFNFPLIDKWYY